ncbi:MAG: ParB/RepB/Spo0J family partition protein [Calditrichia bacterium]
MKSKTRLGRGLNALIPTAPPEPRENRQSIREIEVALIEVNPHQPRLIYDEAAFEELKDSIREKGILQPILVRPVEDGRYQVVAGERRLRAAIDLGLIRIPAFVKNIESDEDMLEIALIENVQREHLNPIDLARGYQRLMEECNLTQEEVARKISKDRATIANVIRLLKLPGAIQKSLQKGEIKEGHARALLGLTDPKLQKEIWRKTIKDSLPVRKVEQLVRNFQKKVENVDQPVAKKARKSVYVNKIENKLREMFGTQVKIRTRKESGAIEISFYSMEDLQRLMDIFDQIKF